MKPARIIAALALIVAFAAPAAAAGYAPSPIAIEALPDITPVDLARLNAAAVVEIATLAPPAIAPAYVAAARKSDGFDASVFARPALAGFMALLLGATLIQLRRTWRHLETGRFGQA